MAEAGRDTGDHGRRQGDGAADGRGPDLRLWLRLLGCTTMIGGEVRSRLRKAFGVTPPRFDLMSQLDRVPGGLSMGELSRRLMVSNGNVTGIADRLLAEGLVSREPSPTDRRTTFVRLTPAGRSTYRAMAAAHEAWIADIFSGLTCEERAGLMRLLDRTERSVRDCMSGKRPRRMERVRTPGMS